MKKRILFSTMVLLLSAFAFVFVSCDKDDEVLVAELTSLSITSPVSAFGIIDQADKTVSINVPFGTDLTDMVGTVTATDGATVSPDLSAGVDFSSLSLIFTVTNGGTTNDYSANIIVGENPLRIALIGDGAYADLDIEVKTAYDWALATYQEDVVQYFSWEDIANTDLSTTTIAWIHHTVFPRPEIVDGPEASNAALIWPEDAISAATIEKITAYAKEGGNLLLTSLAASYVVETGRIDRAYGPTQFDVGGDEYIVNPDNWGISYQEGHFEDGQYPSDNNDYYIFDGLTTSDVTFEGVTYPAVFLSDAGNKKNRANIWIFGRFYNSGDPWYVGTEYLENDPLNTWKDMFEDATSSKVRSSFEWDPAAGGIELGAVVEFGPSGEYTGTTVVISPGAYEWYIVPSADDDSNIWEDNVKGITKNVIDELGGF